MFGRKCVILQPLLLFCTLSREKVAEKFIVFIQKDISEPSKTSLDFKTCTSISIYTSGMREDVTDGWHCKAPTHIFILRISLVR
jgi:hypothetical protein